MCGGAVGQRPGLTKNIASMFVTFATFQSRGWLKLSVFCRAETGEAGDAEARVDAEAAAAGKAGGSCAVARWGSGPGLP